jgi:hypothetical protein
MEPASNTTVERADDQQVTEAYEPPTADTTENQPPQCSF